MGCVTALPLKSAIQGIIKIIIMWYDSYEMEALIWSQAISD